LETVNKLKIGNGEELKIFEALIFKIWERIENNELNRGPCFHYILNLNLNEIKEITKLFSSIAV
jgi:hypothetical protein